jgi:hypothetical protein
MQQQSQEKPNFEAVVTVIRKPSNGPWSVASHKSFDSNQIVEAAQGWHDAIAKIPTQKKLFRGKLIHGFLVPNIRDIVRTLNKEYKRSSDKIEELTSDNQMFKIGDGYDLFFGEKKAVLKAANIFNRAVPYFLESCGRAKTLTEYPFRFSYFPAIAGIILAKLGITKEQTMNSWAFLCGKLLQEADRIHESMFRYRSVNPPPLLIGQRFLIQFMNNPAVALDRFSKAFIPYENWIKSSSTNIREQNAKLPENKRCYGSIKNYKFIWNEIMSLPNGIPTKMAIGDYSQLLMGYNYQKPKDDASKDVSVEDEDIVVSVAE